MRSWQVPCVIARSHTVRYALEEYLALEAASNTKHEFLDGQIYAMAGGTPEHSALTASFAATLHAQLRGGSCRVHSSDLRVRVSETGLVTYPDVTVVCGPWVRDPSDTNTVVNPTLVVEVLSRTTQAYDRGEKREHYMRIPTLQAIVLAAHDRPELEVWTRRDGDRWDRALYGAGEAVVLAAIGARVEVDAVYREASEPA